MCIHECKYILDITVYIYILISFRWSTLVCRSCCFLWAVQIQRFNGWWVFRSFAAAHNVIRFYLESPHVRTPPKGNGKLAPGMYTDRVVCSSRCSRLLVSYKEGFHLANEAGVPRWQTYTIWHRKFNKRL